LTRLWPFFRYERTKADPSSHAPPSEQLSLLWTLHPALSIFRYLSNGMNTFCRLWHVTHSSSFAPHFPSRLGVIRISHLDGVDVDQAPLSLRKAETA